jgi:uncharacterized protein (DUF736 family)
MMIGTFKKDRDGYAGRIFMPGWRSLPVNITPAAAPSAGGPDFVVTTLEDRRSEIEFGAAWKKTSAKGKPYLSVKLDSPTLPQPINGALLEQLNATFTLVWNRSAHKDMEGSDSAAA